ncbi:MAG: alpha-L-rhamnosidase C-terminal domain-containing protein, partial [Planctomycetota bacterium]
YGAGVIYQIGKYILGVEPVAAGFKKFSVLPACDCLKHARGRVPTPHGIIQVEWTQSKDEFNLQIIIPPNTECKAGLPFIDNWKMTVDKKAVQAENIDLRKGQYAITDIKAENSARAVTIKYSNC